jgi:predicted nucleic acid-binding protein
MAEEALFVLDASVAVKWFNQEPFRENALAVRNSFRDGRISLTVPSLLKYEIANALRYNPKFGTEEVRLALKSLEDLQLDVREFDEQLVDGAISSAYRFGITTYDAAYVALAIALQTVLYTADNEIIQKVPKEYVRHISKFSID